MKNSIGTCSISKDSSRVISDSSASWQSVKKGSFIKFSSDSCFYQVIKTNPLSYSQKFEVLNEFQIKIKGNCGAEIFRGDKAILTYNEYELLTVNSIKNAGSNYKVGDVLTVAGGVLALSKFDNQTKVTQIKVNQVSENGEIQRIGLVEKGIYLNYPQVGMMEGGSGSGAVLDIEYNAIPQKKFIEVTVRNVVNSEKESLILVDSVIPSGLKQGDLSVNKWELIINGTYTGESKTAVGYEIYSDFTPNIQLPIILPNAKNQEILITHAFTIIDMKIASIEEKLEFLLSKV